jgi:hypothetical protein
MKKWTRLLAILLMLGMLLSLAACGSKDADKVVRELVNDDADVILLKDFGSPKEYYRAVEQRRADELQGLLLGNALVQNTSAQNAFAQSELRLSLDQSVLSQDLLDLITQLAGMDVSWAKSLSLGVSTGRSGDLSQSSLVLRINDADIIHMDMVTDTKSMTEYIAIPELNEAYFSMNLAEMLSQSGAGLSADEALELLSGYSGQNTVDQFGLLLRYYKLVLDNVDKVEVTEGTVSVGGISCSCNIAKVTIEAEDMERIANAVLDAAAQDKDMEALVYRTMKLSNSFRGSEEDFHAKYQELIEEAREDYKDLEDDGSILMTVYIDEKGEILGHSIEGLSEGEPVMRISFLTARDGDKIGAEVEFSTHNKYSSWENETVVKASGSGTYSSDSGKITGSYLVTYHEMEDYQGKKSEKDLELFNVNMDVTLGKEGMLGEILLTPCDDLINLALEELSGAPAPVTDLVRSLSLALVNKSGDGKVDSSVILRTDGKDLLTLSLTAAPAEAYEISVPADVVDMDTWSQSIGYSAIGTLMNNLRNAGVPNSVFNSLLG